jgi:hexosaminidase
MILRISLLFLLSGLIALESHGQASRSLASYHIVPAPVKVESANGNFVLSSTVKVFLSGADTQAHDAAELFSEEINRATGFHLQPAGKVSKNDRAISLILNKTVNEVLGQEGYTLEVQPARIFIRANKPAGLFYGLQTLLQLLPPEIERPGKVASVKWNIPCVRITDYPRFGWRGLMLDVSRHFFSKEFIKSYIDEMVKYKYNVFHWHLTDNHGWRIEIKGLPNLTETGAWRVPRTGRRGSFLPAQPGEKPTYGGYYTQGDISEIVEYARKRFVTIVPEIDVPAHSLALIASYKNLSCTQVQYQVNPLKKFTEREDDVLCVANDSTWIVLDKIFTQVAALFPGEYIHMGGDEAFKGYWENCPKDQALMKREGISTLEGLQSYFVKKLEKIISAKGKKMIGWDEILEGGLAPGIPVMSWRDQRGNGIQSAADAARSGHQVVVTPHSAAYLDLYQGDPVIEPFTYGQVRLKTCYEMEPVPEGADEKQILGGQGNLWTEAVPNNRHAEYMTWPRGLALAETFWSQKQNRSWPDFIKRMEWQFQRLDAAQVKYARSAYDAIISAVKGSDDSLKVKLETEIPGIDIYYTFDGTNPDNFYPAYEGSPLDIPTGASEIRVITYRDGKPVGKQINFMLDGLKKRLPKL